MEVTVTLNGNGIHIPVSPQVEVTLEVSDVKAFIKPGGPDEKGE